MSTQDQSACFIIMILSAVFLLFATSSSGVRYRGSECSARKVTMGKKDDSEDVSARAANIDDAGDGDEEEEVTKNDIDPMDFMPLSDKSSFEGQFAAVITKATKDVKKLEAGLRDPSIVESKLGRYRGIQITGTLASCNDANKPLPSPPTGDTMLSLPTAFS